MLKKMRQVLKSERGQVTVVEIVILVAIIAVVVSLFGVGLKEVFVGESEEGGVVNSLKEVVDGKFGEAMPTQLVRQLVIAIFLVGSYIWYVRKMLAEERRKPDGNNKND